MLVHCLYLYAQMTTMESTCLINLVEKIFVMFAIVGFQVDHSVFLLFYFVNYAFVNEVVNQVAGNMNSNAAYVCMLLSLI